MAYYTNFIPDSELIKKLSGDIEERLDSYRKISNWLKLVIVLSIIISLTFLIIFIVRCIISKSILDIPKWFAFIILFVPFIAIILHNKFDKKTKDLRKIFIRNKKSFKNGNEMNDIIRLNLDFFFYLRDFSSGRYEVEKTPIPGSGITGVANPALWDVNYGKPTTNTIIKYFEKFSPIAFLNNVDETTVLKGGLTIYSDNETWAIYLKTLVDKAKFIVVDYELNSDFLNSLTNNIQFEIEYIISLGEKKVILVGTKEEIRFIYNKYPELKKLVVACCLKSKILENYNHKTVDFLEVKKILGDIN